MADLVTIGTAAASAGNLSQSDILVHLDSPESLTYRNSNDLDAAQPSYVRESFSPIAVSHDPVEEAQNYSQYWRHMIPSELNSNRRVPATIEPIGEYASPSLTLMIASNDDYVETQYQHDQNPPSPALDTPVSHATDSGSGDNLRMMLARTRPTRESKGHLGYFMKVIQKHAEDVPWSFPGLEWILPKNAGTWTHHQLPEYSLEKSALWTSYPELAERLEYLCDLKPNWDGYESLAITAVAARKCARLLVATDRHIYSQAGTPFLAPMADGGIELEWEGVCSRELTVVIPPEGAPVRYLLTSYNEGDGMDELCGDFTRESAVNTLLESILP